MTQKTEQPAKRSAPAAGRDAKLAAALRANLVRRKSAARLAMASTGETDQGDEK